MVHIFKATILTLVLWEKWLAKLPRSKVQNLTVCPEFVMWNLLLFAAAATNQKAIMFSRYALHDYLSQRELTKIALLRNLVLYFILFMKKCTRTQNCLEQKNLFHRNVMLLVLLEEVSPAGLWKRNTVEIPSSRQLHVLLTHHHDHQVLLKKNA